MVISWIDYCNAVVSGVYDVHLWRVQGMLWASARMIFQRRKYDVADLLRDTLYWLAIYKLCRIVYKCLNGVTHRTLWRCANQFPMSPAVAVYVPQPAVSWLSREAKRQRTDFATSVVRTSVFGWRTFPGLRLIYGWHVKSVRYRSTNQASSVFHLFGDGKCIVIRVITWMTGVETIKRQTWAVYGCLVAGQSSCPQA